MKKYFDVLKELREDNDLYQQDIANILKIDKSYYGKYERGQIPLPIEHLIKLCNYYKVSADYVLGISYDYKRPKKEDK